MAGTVTAGRGSYGARVETSGRRSGTTWAALSLATAVAAVPVASATSSALKALGVVDVSRQAALDARLGDAGFSYDERGIRTAEGVAALVEGPVAVAFLIVLAGLWTWRPWAREGAFGVYGLGGAALSVLSLSGLSQDPPGRNAGLGLLVGLAALAVVVLLLLPPARADAERRVVERRVRQRQADAAARRARDGS